MPSSRACKEPCGKRVPRGAQPTPPPGMPSNFTPQGHTRTTHPPSPEGSGPDYQSPLTRQYQPLHHPRGTNVSGPGSPGGKNRKMHELTRQARSPATFYLPEPNYTNSQCDRVWRVAAPKGLGGAGPQEKVHCHGEGGPPPRALGMGQNKAFWRGRMESWTESRQHKQ